MTGNMTGHALGYARRGWPIFPCQPGSKQPATRHGFHDATTDPDKIAWWWRREPNANLAIATGTPGPDILDVDQHGAAGNGFTALCRLTEAGLVKAPSRIVSTPNGGLHAYFTGSDQSCGRLRRHHLDFRAQGGYVLAPPSQIGGKPYRVRQHQAGSGRLDWATVTELLEPGRATTIRPATPAGGDLNHLLTWVASLQPDSHNRNDGLFWAACRAAEAGDEAVLAGLAIAARATGLTNREIRRTIDSARRTAGLRPREQHAAREATS